MDLEDMAAKAKQLEEKGDQFHTIVTQMESLVKQLCAAWTGASSVEFDAQFARLKPGFQDTEDLIDDLAQQIRDIGNIMADTDDKVAEKLKKS